MTKLPIIHFYNAPWRGMRMIALCAPFVVLAIWHIQHKRMSVGDYILDGIVILFFGAGLLLGFFHLLDRRPQLILTVQTFWARQLSLPPVRWEEIQDARLFKARGTVILNLKLDQTYVFPQQEYSWVKSMRYRIRTHRYGVPVSGIQVDAEKLRALVLKMAACKAAERAALLDGFGR
jgi:hypothetical protein